MTLRIYISQGIVPGAEKVRGRYWIRKEPFDAWVLKGERLEGAAQPEPLRVVKKEVA